MPPNSENAGEKQWDKVKGGVQKVVDKALGGKSVAQQSRFGLRVLKRMRQLVGEQAVMQFRADFLKAMPEDLREWRAKGMTDEEITAETWDVPEFRELWIAMGMNEDNFKAALRGNKDKEDNGEQQ